MEYDKKQNRKVRRKHCSSWLSWQRRELEFIRSVLILRTRKFRKNCRTESDAKTHRWWMQTPVWLTRRSAIRQGRTIQQKKKSLRRSLTAQTVQKKLQTVFQQIEAITETANAANAVEDSMTDAGRSHRCFRKCTECPET